MSRIGKLPITIKDGVNVEVTGQTVTVKGAKGELSFIFDKSLSVKVNENIITVAPKAETDDSRRLHGLTRTLIDNMVVGVSDGFKKKLEFKGTGYRAAVNGNDLVLNMGYSHPVEMAIPEGLEVKVEKNTITVSGFDKQQVGQFAAEIRAVRKPEPYKGKGIKYQGEHIRRKAGKTAAK